MLRTAMMTLAIAGSLASASTSTHAQDVTPEEVRAAIPVNEPPRKASPAETEPEHPNVLRAQPVAPGESEPPVADPAEPVLRAEPVGPGDTQRPTPPVALPAQPIDEDTGD